MKFSSVVLGAAVGSPPNFAMRASTLNTKRFFTRLIATAAILCVSFAGNARAASKTYVSNFAVAGNPDPADTGECGSTAPCRTFSYAYSQTDVGGEIICMSSGSFGSMTINQSITISCLGTSASAAYIDIYTLPSDRVVIRGVDVQGLSSPTITFNNAGTLILDQVKVSGAASNASGLYFRPTGAGKLIVTDSLLNTRGSTSSGAAIRIQPSSGGTAQAILSRVSLAGSAFGVAVDGSNSSGGINVTINDSDMAGSAQDGLVATSTPSGAPIGVTVINSRSANNGFGIRSIGSNVTVRVEGSKIIGNGVGLSGGGALLSGGGNTVEANANNGAFTGSYALK